MQCYLIEWMKIKMNKKLKELKNEKKKNTKCFEYCAECAEKKQIEFWE